VNGGLVAALAGLGLGAGFLWWQKKQAAAAAAPSTCEALCIAGARAAGVTGDLSALCKQGCNLGGLVDGVKGTAVSVGNLVGGIVGGGSGPAFCSTCCPKGSTPEFSDRLFGDRTTSTGDQTHLRDQRTPSSVNGAVCVDTATGAILGTLTDKFNPYSVSGPSSAPAPVRKVPMPGSTRTSGGTTTTTTPSGGVTVTENTTQQDLQQQAQQTASKYGFNISFGR
jgi:hypothetical protein